MLVLFERGNAIESVVPAANLHVFSENLTASATGLAARRENRSKRNCFRRKYPVRDHGKAGRFDERKVCGRRPGCK